MYVESVPNRNSPPAILLRESSRIDGKIVKRTVANLSSWPATQIDALRRVLKHESLVAPSDAFQILRSSPHGHVAAALGTLRRLALEPILSRSGHSRDERSGNLQIVFGLLTNSEGCPVAVEVFEGNTGDPTTVASQVSKLRQRFQLKQVVLVGDRGMLTSARIREDLKPQEGLQWISALKSIQIQQLVQGGALQLSLFDQHDLAEIQHASYRGERLIAGRNPLLAEERSRKRKELLEATEKQLTKIVEATQRKKKPLRGRKEIGLAVGKILGRYKMGKHFSLFIEEDGFRCERKQSNIEREAALDGIYVIRTSVSAESLSSEQVVGHYKKLSDVERAFRSLKSVDLKIRPIYHHLSHRVRAHLFLCMLSYYVEWHMRRVLAPMLFDDDAPQARPAARQSIVTPAEQSPRAKDKDLFKRP